MKLQLLEMQQKERFNVIVTSPIGMLMQPLARYLALKTTYPTDMCMTMLRHASVDFLARAQPIGDTSSMRFQ